MKKLVDCSTPYCNNKFLIDPLPGNKELLFCKKCREEHSSSVLRVQYDLEAPIKEILLDAKEFGSAGKMSDYIGVSFVTIYNWIMKYFNMSFQEFKREYICRSNKCKLINISRSSYSRNDYVLKKIKNQRYCACINALEPGYIMTNAPINVVSQVLRGFPTIKKISDGVFSIVPTPFRFTYRTPISFKDV